MTEPGRSEPKVTGPGRSSGPDMIWQGVLGPDVTEQRASGPDVTGPETPKAPTPASVPSSKGKLHSVPTKGDGRCFFQGFLHWFES